MTLTWSAARTGKSGRTKEGLQDRQFEISQPTLNASSVDIYPSPSTLTIYCQLLLIGTITLSEAGVPLKIVFSKSFSTKTISTVRQLDPHPSKEEKKAPY